MFFLGKSKEDERKIEELQKRVASLESELLLYQDTIAFSQEEMFVALDTRGEIILQNDKANTVIIDENSRIVELLLFIKM